MEIIGFPAGPLETNCYVATGHSLEPGEAADGPTPVVVIDPGMGALERLRKECAERNLEPEAVLLTHGHIDHTRDVGDVAREWDVPVLISPHDRFMLDNPLIGAGLSLGQMFNVSAMVPPSDIGDLDDGEEVKFAGLAFEVIHAPGHSPGCVMLRATDGADEVVFSGDVIFAGSIGRTDLPGADPTAMMESLKNRVLPLDDALAILPGHGPTSTIGQEKAANPFLAQVK
ncbi:MBL fold metallo-hydrolase [uncultured Corynebacterium sp.]|uniref:MBL fold metallo-hydrolase n=1 Tax=uncultured Corynebacterium sp. TaxID=159447 RepID=UPI0025ECD9E0|nr:MBL fold metallo-hydrolase [uncultured Corynebacterium sp.]